MVKPGSKDHKASILINGLELDELQRFDWMMAESFGLDRRIADSTKAHVPSGCGVGISNAWWK